MFHQLLARDAAALRYRGSNALGKMGASADTPPVFHIRICEIHKDWPSFLNWNLPYKIMAKLS